MDALDTMRSLIGYNHWVNDRLLDVVEQVPPERTREQFGGSFDTIQGTAAHILQGEMHYYTRWTGGSWPREWRPAGAVSIAELRGHWTEERRKIDAYVNDLKPDRLADVIRYTTRSGEAYELPIWQLMLQMVNHGTHHRAELADMLTRVGSPPPPTDIIVYFQEQAKGGG